MTDQAPHYRIGQRDLNTEAPVYLIAHLGLNHNGRTAEARRLIKQADAAGADAVSLPVYRTDSVVSEEAELVPGRRGHVGDLARNQRNMLGRFELALEAIDELTSLAGERNLDVVPAPRDRTSLSHVRSLDPDALLLAAGDLTFPLFADQCGNTDVPLLLSTGVTTLEELDQVMEHLRDRSPVPPLVPLYQVRSYPPEAEELDLKTIPAYENRYDTPTGFLDHTTTHQAAESAVSLGARVIGKYLTSDPEAEGPHHAISLEPERLHTFIERIRTLESALGRGEKLMPDSEQRARPYLRRSLAVTSSLDEGTSLRKEHLTALRPEEGIPADQMDQVLGKRLTTQKHAGEHLYKQDLAATDSD